MKSILKRYLLTTASVFVTTYLIPSFVISDGWYWLFYASFILSILLYIIRPILGLIMLPLNLITLNLSSWIVQIVIFYLWTVLVHQVKISAWQFPGIHFGAITLASVNLVKWQVVIVVALVVLFINKFLDWLFK